MRVGDDKTTRLRQHADLALDLERLLESPAIIGFFRSQRDQTIAAMASAKIDDDVSRRNAAIMLAVINDLEKHLGDCVTRGKRALVDLKKLEKQREKSDVTT